jgi:sugar phosphate isomerase/epimerase
MKPNPALFQAIVAAALLLTVSKAGASCVPVPDGKIAFELFNLLPALHPSGPPPGAVPADRLASAFAGMHAIGFRNMERVDGTLGLSSDAYRKAAHDNGLAVIGGHDSLDAAQWDQTLDRARALGQTYVGAAGFGEPGLDTLEHTLATAANLNRLGRAAAAKGLRLFVHNHEGEIATRFSYDLTGHGKKQPVPAWEIVAANTDPRLVTFEVDIHWTWRALGIGKSADLLAFLEKYRGRIELLHIKDTAANGGITDLGKGITDWPAVIKAAGPGVRYYIWEYDNDPDVFKSARIAYDFLRCRQGFTW